VRGMKKISRKIGVFSVLLFLLLPLWGRGETKQKISLKGEPLINSFLKEDISAVVFSTKKGTLITYRGMISGFNHNLEGEKIKEEAVSAIKYTKEGKVKIRGTRLEGKQKLEETNYLNIKEEVINLLKKNADITIDKDTTYEGGSIGSYEEPKIVVVNNAKLLLKKDFKGYGVLILTGEDASSFYRLYMYDNAAWYGLIVSDIKNVGIYLKGKITPFYYLGGYKSNNCIIYKKKMLRYKKLYEKYKKLYEEKCTKKKLSLPPKSHISQGKASSWQCEIYKKYYLTYKKLYEKYKKLYEKCAQPPSNHQPKILGALILEGEGARISLSGAKILYCKEAIEEEICKKLIGKIGEKEILPLKLEEYKEE